MEREKFFEQVRKFINEHTEEYAKEVLLRSVLVKRDGKWLNVITIANIPLRNEDVPHKENITYDVFELREHRISVENFFKLLDSISQVSGASCFSEHPYSQVWFGGVCSFEEGAYLPSNNEYSQWPGMLFRCGGGNVDPIDYPPVRYGTPCFRDGFHAVQVWTGIKKPRDRFSHLGQFLIFLPNYKARLKNLEFKDEKLCVEVEGGTDLLSNLECQAVFKIENKDSQENKRFDGTAVVEFPIKTEPIETYVQLVTAKGEKIDYYMETPMGHTGKNRLIKREVDKDLLEKIRNGENERVEFKPFYNKEHADDVLETVISFANTKGGSVLFGVKDNCELLGVPPQILKGKTETEFFKETKQELRTLVSNKASKAIELDFKEHKVANNYVLELVVKEGTDKPYSTIPDNKIYVRKGSTDRYPTEEELGTLFSLKNKDGLRFPPLAYM